MNQVIFNIISWSCLILLGGLSSLLIFNVSKFINISQAAVITSGAYLTFFLYSIGLPLLPAILVSIVGCILLGISIDKFIFLHMRKANLSSFKLLIASVGLYTVLQNLISLLFGDDIKSIRTGEAKVGHQILGAYVTGIQIITIIISAVLFIAVLLLIHKTSLGRQFRAVSNSPELSNIYGINSNRIILWATAISAALSAIAGILIALDVDMTPTFGFNYFLYGVVAMIIGGVGSYRGLVFGSLLLATSQHLAAYYIDTKWMDAMAYIILILFLIWKPLGFSGVRLRKVEI
jgi:branched-subunit amino acid ABC-type transport system permease component